MIVSGSWGGVKSILKQGVYSRRGRFHIMSLVSSKSNIEFIVLVAAILDYGDTTLLHVDEDDHIGFLCRFNVCSRMLEFRKYRVKWCRNRQKTFAIRSYQTSRLVVFNIDELLE